MNSETAEHVLHRWRWALLSCLIVLLLSAVGVVCSLGRAETILPNTYVAGTAVGGMTRAEAETALAPLGAACAETRVLLCHDGALLASLTCRQLGARPDLAGAVECAWRRGREQEGVIASFSRGWQRLFPPRRLEITPRVVVDREQLAALLPDRAEDARYDKAAGEVVDGHVGILLDIGALEQALTDAAPGSIVKFPAEIEEQQLDADTLRALLFRDELGRYTTAVSGTRVRKNNVALSAAAIDGTVLLSGEEFDFNAVVGERTTARGYGGAPSYVNGETVDTVGGGICQTSSTLYVAAVLSDLAITERHNHRYLGSYVPPGFDATVSWGGPEFRFRNTTPYPIRIRAEMKGDRLTVRIEGSKLDDHRVELTGRTVSTTGYATRYEETDALAPGVTQVKQKGYAGCTVETCRSIYDGGGRLLSSVTESRSVYASRDAVVLVGRARPAETPSPEAPAPEETPADTP